METMSIRYKAVMNFEEIVGGIPESKDVVKSWLSANSIQDNEELAEKIASETIQPDELEKELAGITTTFLKTEKGEPAIESRCIKAAIKQAAGVMGLYSAVPGLKELIKEGSEVWPRLIPIVRPDNSQPNLETGTKLDNRHSNLEIAIKLVHTKDKTGQPVNGIGRYRFVRNCQLAFEICVTDRTAITARYGKKEKEEPKLDKNGKPKLGRRGKQNDLSDEMLADILRYVGQFTGLGSNRSQGFGKGQLVKLERFDGTDWVAIV